MTVISEADRSLLIELLEECEQSAQFVWAKRFRADHFPALESIDRLVASGHIVYGHGRYRVSLVALQDLDSKTAFTILKHSETIWAWYQKHYRDHLNEMAPLQTTADACEIGVVAAQRAVAYMMEAPWHAGLTESGEQRFIAIAVDETVLRYSKFADLINQLTIWKVQAAATHASVDGPAIAPIAPSTGSFLPDWVCLLPSTAQQLLSEVDTAIKADLLSLSAMGIRAVVDVVSFDTLQGDVGSFKAKLAELRKAGHMTDVQHEALSAVVEAGNAASHRGYIPDAVSVKAMLAALLFVLHSIYILKITTQDLRSKTPARP